MSAASMNRTNWLSRIVLGSVYAFLYLPILWLIVYSFNESNMVTLWGGFSFKWYHEILHDREIIDGVWLSLRIAFLSASVAVILGTFAAFVLVRYRRFFSRTLFAGMVNAPLVMPEVIVGLSLLLMLVMVQRWLGFPERGMLTIFFGHVMLGMAYAAVVVQSRLKELNMSLEEAAMDLGCRPIGVFWHITLPMIAQSMLSAWLLTFTVSLDDVVLSAFLSGPGSSPLPIVIFSRAKLGLNAEVNVVAAITILLVSIGVIWSSLYLARKERRHAREIAEAFSEANAG
jgi:putrescine transport system permease protein